jgi:hypothetical protein
LPNRSDAIITFSSLRLFTEIIEGGEYVIDATVRELARRTNAEVLVLDAVHLAAGEWGAFGKGMSKHESYMQQEVNVVIAANSLQLPRNPLHFRASQPSHSRPFFPEEDEEDSDQPSGSFTPSQMTFMLLTNAAQSGRSLSSSQSRRSGPPTKIQVFFETIVNAVAQDEPEQKQRPRLIYIRGTFLFLLTRPV